MEKSPILVESDDLSLKITSLKGDLAMARQSSRIAEDEAVLLLGQLNRLEVDLYHNSEISTQCWDEYFYLLYIFNTRVDN